jgi:hypothetical protein
MGGGRSEGDRHVVAIEPLIVEGTVGQMRGDGATQGELTGALAQYCERCWENFGATCLGEALTERVALAGAGRASELETHRVYTKASVATSGAQERLNRSERAGQGQRMRSTLGIV